MKKILASFSLILFFSLVGFSQGPPQYSQTANFKSVTTKSFDVSGRGLGYYKIKWEVARGTLSGCSVELDGGNDNVAFGTTLISTQTCTTDGQTAITGVGTGGSTSYIQINVTSYTATSPGVSLNVTVSGWNDFEAGSITIGTANFDTTGLATSANQSTTNTKLNGGLPAALGTGGGLKVDGSGTALPITGTLTAVTSITNALPVGSNVIGHVIADTGSTTAVTSLPAIPAGTNVIGHVIADTSSAVIGHVIVDSGAATGVAQGSTTSGQVGPLIQCAVTTAAPSYTNAQTSPCSLDTSGQLRITGTVSAGGVAQGSTTSGQTGGLTQAAVTTAAPTYTTGQTNPLSLDTAGNLRITTGTTDAAIGATPTSNPAQTGGLFETSRTTVSNNQVAAMHFTNDQLLLVQVPNGITVTYSGLTSGGTASMTGTTSTSVIAGTASNYIYVESCSVGNTHASVDTLVDLQDGSGGAVIWTFTALHGYGGESHTFGKPLKVPTIGNGLFAVNETTGAAVKVFCNGYKSTISQ